MIVTVKVKQEVVYLQEIDISKEELKSLTDDSDDNEIYKGDMMHDMLSSKLDLSDVYDDGNFSDFEKLK